jgi:hypothetical protein
MFARLLVPLLVLFAALPSLTAESDQSAHDFAFTSIEGDTLGG